jgi:hypothetical protein
MKKLFSSVLAILIFATSAVAVAAPPASGAPATPCAHCRRAMRHGLGVRPPRAALFGADTHPCPHRGSTAARRGNGQKPCPERSHSV